MKKPENKSEYFEDVIRRSAGMRGVIFMVPLSGELTLRVMDHANSVDSSTEAVIAEAVRSYFGGE